MIVLHVTAPAEIGGLERVVQFLALGQQRRGVETHVAAILTGERDHPFAEPLARAGVVVHTLRAGSRAYREELRQFSELCQRVAPNVVHTHGYRADVLDASVARAAGIPTVTTAHGFTGGGFRNRAYERLQTIAFRRFSAVVAVSEPLADRLRRSGIPESVLHVVPNAWAAGDQPIPRRDARALLGVADDRPLVGWVGRLSREKGADLLLAALARLSDLDLTVAMIGSGPERAALERRALELGLSERVHWHGAIPDAARIFSAFDLFALTSRTEGTPIVLLEAMAAGVPIVATAVGGVPRMLAPEEALIVAPESPWALGRALRESLTDPAGRRARVARATLRLQRDFAGEAWLERYESLYAMVSFPRLVAMTP